MTPFQLCNSRVAIRDIVEDDRGDFLEWAADKSIYRYMAFRFDSPEDSIAEFERLLRHPSRTASPRRHFYTAVVDVEGDTEAFAGISGFDVHRDGSGEFGWYLASRYWNKGLATEATSLLLYLGFDVLRLPVLRATCDPENAASRRVLEKGGLSFVGERAEPIPTWAGTRPRLEFEMLRGDWVERAPKPQIVHAKSNIS